MTARRYCRILGYKTDLLPFYEASDFVFEKAAKNEPLHIITINPEIIAAADKNKELADIIENSELVLPESTGIICALKLRGIKQEKIPGIDFAHELIKRSSGLNYPIAALGAQEHIIEKVCGNLKKEFSNLNIAYKRNGYFSNEEEAGIIEEISKSGAKLVLCALGAPKQELFINKCIKKHNAVYIGIGGSFDVWAGEVRRAPEIWRKLGLEWLYRTIKQPSRFKRIYKTLPAFLFRVLIEALRASIKH